MKGIVLSVVIVAAAMIIIFLGFIIALFFIIVGSVLIIFVDFMFRKIDDFIKLFSSPGFIRITLRTYYALHNKLGEMVSLFGLILILLHSFFVYLFNRKIPILELLASDKFLSDYIFYGIIIIYLFIYLVTRWIIQRRFTSTRGKFIYSEDHLSFSNQLLKINNINTLNYKFELATKDDANKLGQISHEAFENTVWAAPEREKIQLLESHINVNKDCVLKIIENGTGTIGFTHIIPVSQHTWEEYKDGGISDNNLTAEYVLTSSSSAYGLILFALAMVDANGKSLRYYDKKSGEVFLEAIKNHLDMFLKTSSPAYFDNEPFVHVLFQTVNRKLLKYFDTEPGYIAKDGGAIIIFKIKNV